VKGYEIAKEIDMLKPTMGAIRNHHEKWDGSGYPDGLKAEAIPLSARLVAIADAYDAMATDRPYKKALPLEECEKLLRKNSGVMFDPNLVEVFVARHVGAIYREDYEGVPVPSDVGSGRVEVEAPPAKSAPVREVSTKVNAQR
jgi:HD-GYP domain-containing protein (c-di-GMP phosphodiesterase class II)